MSVGCQLQQLANKAINLYKYNNNNNNKDNNWTDYNNDNWDEHENNKLLM